VASNKALIIAHRGESHDAPENTLAAICLAWERDADAVEIDVHLTKDGSIVVIHDDNTLRTAHRYGEITKQTLAQLRQLDVGKFKGKRWAKERIPTLEEVLDTVPAGKKLFVEIKVDADILAELNRVLKRSSRSPDQVVLVGMDLHTMEILKKALPRYHVYWVCSMKDEKKLATKSNPGEGLIARARQTGMDGLDIEVSKKIDEKFIARVKDAGMKLYVWTVDDPGEARRLFAVGVDGIATNRAHWLKTRLGDDLDYVIKGSLAKPKVTLWSGPPPASASATEKKLKKKKAERRVTQ
jgi:glycerophosphoryl diester phosphodiesterase